MKKFYRSSENKVFLGILGGLGEYFEVDPVVLRALAVVLCILTAFFPLFLAYILLAFIVPKNREDGKKNDKRPLYKKFWFWFIFLFIFVLSLFLAVLLGIIFSHNQIRKERDGVFIQYTYIDTEDEIKIFENIKKDGFVF